MLGRGGLLVFGHWKESLTPHQPSFYPRRPRKRRPIPPEDGVAGYEIGQCAGKKEETGEDAEDVEKGEAAGAFIWV